MAVLFADGFDWYTTADLFKRWTGAPGGGAAPQIVNTISRSPSGQALLSGGNSAESGTPYRSFGADYTQGVVGFAFYSTLTMSNRGALVAILDGTSEQISVRTNGSSVPTITRRGTVLATGSTVLAVNTWYYLELKFTIHNAAGVVELRINGASEIASTSSLNTRTTGTARWNGVGVNSANIAPFWYYDDLYVLDPTAGANTDFLGPVQVVARYPDGNGAHSDWTPNGGSNMGCVSEPYEDGNASFNQSSTANQVDTFTMQNVPAATGPVIAVAHHTVAAQDGGAARTIRPKYRISGTDYNGASVNTGASYAFLTEVKDVSPATSSAWTIAEVNGMETGYELVS